MAMITRKRVIHRCIIIGKLLQKILRSCKCSEFPLERKVAKDTGMEIKMKTGGTDSLSQKYRQYPKFSFKKTDIIF